MALDLGSSTSRTDNKTNNVNRSQTVSDQAVALQLGQNAQLGGKRQKLKLGKKASYTGDTSNTVTNVYGQDSASILTALTGLLPRPESAPSTPIETRVNDQIAAGGTEAREQIKGTLPKGTWAVIVIGVVIVLAFAVWKVRKKKG